MRSHNRVISAVSTERLGSFLKDDFEPRVAASLPSFLKLRAHTFKLAILPEQAKPIVPFGQEFSRKEHGADRSLQLALR
jgi:hypothetical protein